LANQARQETGYSFARTYKRNEHGRFVISLLTKEDQL